MAYAKLKFRLKTTNTHPNTNFVYIHFLSTQNKSEFLFLKYKCGKKRKRKKKSKFTEVAECVNGDGIKCTDRGKKFLDTLRILLNPNYCYRLKIEIIYKYFPDICLSFQNFGLQQNFFLFLLLLTRQNKNFIVVLVLWMFCKGQNHLAETSKF